jgi:UDP-N-acetylmuramoyl-tripeptide--D-alanyl-D-alanine ligase
VNANYGLITNVGRAHLEGFGSFEGVKQTKGELYDAMKLRGAPIFLNAFDDDLRTMAEERGFCLFDSAVPYVDAHLLSCNPFLSFEWSAEQNKPSHSVQTQLVGAYNMANLRAAVTVALHFGVEPERIDEALEEYVPTNNRSEFRKTDRNQLIVDAYNANPTSMAAALTNFSLIEAPHKMVILGEMRELGEESLSEHRKVCEQLQQLAVERIWLVGENFCKVSEQWPKLMLPQVTLFANVQEVKDTLQKDKLTDYTILVKGSNGTRLFELPALL